MLVFHIQGPCMSVQRYLLLTHHVMTNELSHMYISNPAIIWRENTKYLVKYITPGIILRHVTLILPIAKYIMCFNLVQKTKPLQQQYCKQVDQICT